MDLFQSLGFGSSVERLLDKFHCPGVSIALVQNHTIASAGYGLTHLDPPRSMTPDTIFQIASASKSLTGASIALLVDDNTNYPNVTWTSTMTSLLPDDFVMSEDSHTKQITIDDILGHRTGLPPHEASYFGERSSHPDNAKSLTRNLRNLPIVAPIRTEFIYNNIMYTVASHLIETLSGLKFADFLQAHFFGPLGMNSTNLGSIRAKVKGLGNRLTPGYLWDDKSNNYTSFEVQELAEAQGGGSIRSSVNDYIKYIEAIMHSNAPFSKTMYEGIIHTRFFVEKDYMRRWPLTSSGLYAAGWGVTFYRGHMIISHGGADPGVCTATFFLPSVNFGGVIMTNSLGGCTMTEIMQSQLVDEALKVPKNERLDWEKEPIALEDNYDTINTNKSLLEKLCPGIGQPQPQTTPLSAYNGSYWNAGYRTMTVGIDNDHLHINASDRSGDFQLDFKHICEQTKYIAYKSFHLENTQLALPAEFKFEDGRVVKMGLLLEDKMNSLIWFDKQL
ncbi:hypothetical protein QQS21_010356 [Conoideocrella luteorostrata]|uniref:Uncharacterized protein n=1 Tax=Conoideocrella luteorostrata TaxID=1105319 RepID=A0AAJ0CHV2_9HYPO|nr:hypothetical protein QQS21_010356 [Conoideocrella luteorostrata]